MKRVFLLLPILLIAAACDSSQVAQVQRENADLKSQASQQQQFDLSAKCADQAATFYKDFTKDQTGSQSFSYTNHWNKSASRCFILVTGANVTTDKWYSSEDLFDAIEGKSYGSFSIQLTTDAKPLFCEMNPSGNISGMPQICHSQEEFDNFVTPYMNN